MGIRKEKVFHRLKIKMNQENLKKKIERKTGRFKKMEQQKQKKKNYRRRKEENKMH